MPYVTDKKQKAAAKMKAVKAKRLNVKLWQEVVTIWNDAYLHRLDSERAVDSIMALIERECEKVKQRLIETKAKSKKGIADERLCDRLPADTCAGD